MSLDDRAMPHNTPEARAALVNAPWWAALFTFATFPGAVPEMFVKWTNGDRCAGMHDTSGAVLYGPAGGGKTSLGIDALKFLARLGYGSTFYWNMVTAPGYDDPSEPGEPQLPSPCWFISWATFLASLRPRGNREGSVSFISEAVWFADLEERVLALMLDDVDVDAGTPFRESLLLRHMEWATVPGRRLILTLNSPPARWGGIFGERIADRLADPARFTLVPVLGKSLR